LRRGERRSVGVGKMRVTKSTDTNSQREYRATLQACCVHRCFCAADASTPARSESADRIAQREKVNAEKQDGSC
jgi:hypothetical protein